MNRVFEFADRGIDRSPYIAILIGEPERDQRHIGILHRAEGSAEPRVLHLAWHCLLKNDANIPVYFNLCVVPAFNSKRLRQVAAYCRRVWTKHEHVGIPYVFSPPIEALDRVTGAFLIGPSRFGLTCASFVLAVFETAGLSLLAYETWKTNRPGDREWQEKVVEKLAGVAEQSHVGYVRSEIGAVRYRPEEVAAGAALSPPPTDIARASALGMQIISRIRGQSASSPNQVPPRQT